MKKMRLGKTDVFLPVIGLGTWEMGGGISPDPSNDKESIRAIVRAVELGMTHIDTAEYYGAGHTEELVGKALKEIDRDKVFLTSKVWPNHLKIKDMLKSVEGSLKRLGTDHLDLYLIHWPPEDISITEAIKNINTVLERGYTRYIGVSNFSISQLKEAMEASKNPIVCDQVRYNIEDREIEKAGLLDFCQKNGISVVAYSPLNRMGISITASKLHKIAKERNLTPAQIALAWLVKKGVFSIPKAISEKHLVENAKAGDIELTEEEMKFLE
ncbi:MAG: aldo/keto reductase [Mesoaciditoga sp.]|uniref:aldo/keto reductase n=1 Tax=Athalassotoga sp. TaxID=2022597 RepID=UPI000CB020BC|nr:MAG: aldo/keto reductase [Mesoaciditoga sp.]HEU25074.1 aldo/keto reductase [Mesoaciditoga lauensis]